jgi:broad specificity phosphatase PhoE
MGKAYLLRHGETEYHAQQRILGRLDIGLNDRGQEQARRVMDYFADMDLAAVYCSPLRRCRETGQPTVESKGLEMTTVDGLMEVEMGEWDGRPIKELFASEGEAVGRWMRNPSSIAIPGGEDFGTVKERVMAAVNEITDRHSGDESILIVTHGGPIRSIICEALEMDLDKMFRLQIDLASVSIIKYFERGIPDTAMVTLLNETSHLH